MRPSSKRLLLVEDDERICSVLLRALSHYDFHVDVAHSLREARARPVDCYCALLLDIGLPDGNGLDFCRELRSQGESIPVIILTARNAPDECVHGLEAGADDYLTKPFHTPELIARIHALLRRAQMPTLDASLQVNGIRLNPLDRKVHIHGREIELKPKLFDLLHFFMRHPGRTYTRNQLLERVWALDFIGDTRTVDTHVSRLRMAIEVDPKQPHWLQTVWSVGYRFNDESFNDAE